MWILVVEDDPYMGEAVAQGLREENHTVTLAHDGPEALAALETCSYDAVILDVMLPGINGVEVAKRVRKAGDLPPRIRTKLTMISYERKGEADAKE